MRAVWFVATLLLLCVSGCATTTIVPNPMQEGQSLTAESAILQQGEEFTVAVKVRDMLLRPSPVEQGFCSFWVEVANQRGVKLPLSYKDFLLFDDQGRQYTAYDPDELVAFLKPEIPYLMPYPYVGFYYLDNAAKSRAINETSTEAPYFASRRPEYIKLDALPEGDVLPSANVAGAIYFAAELRNMKTFKIRYQAREIAGWESFPMEFLFSVENSE